MDELQEEPVDDTFQFPDERLVLANMFPSISRMHVQIDGDYFWFYIRRVIHVGPPCFTKCVKAYNALGLWGRKVVQKSDDRCGCDYESAGINVDSEAIGNSNGNYENDCGKLGCFALR